MYGGRGLAAGEQTSPAIGAQVQEAKDTARQVAKVAAEAEAAAKEARAVARGGGGEHFAHFHFHWYQDRGLWRRKDPHFGHNSRGGFTKAKL